MFKYYVMMTPDMGRGVFAERDLQPGEIITNCEVLVLSERDTNIVNDMTDLRYYTFKYDERRDCLVLGDGEIFNHSDNENVAYTLRMINDRPIMEFTATKPVRKNEQLFINYSHDILVNTKTYQVNLVG